jgi:hypothetical protein
MDRAGDELLPGSALSCDQDTDVGAGDLIDHLADRPHDGARADELRWRARLLIERRLEAPDFLAHGAIAHRALDRDDHVVDVERLGDEVERARPDRRDRGLEGTERGDDDDRYVPAALGDPLAEVDPVHPSHVEVGDDDVEVLTTEKVEGLRRDRAPGNLDPVIDELGRHRLAHRAVIVDEQNTGHEASCGRNTAKVVPFPGAVATSIQPPWSWTIP